MIIVVELVLNEFVNVVIGQNEVHLNIDSETESIS